MPVVNTGLIESTRNRLRYLLTDTAVSPPIVDALTILNRGGAALTDLQTDLIAAMAGAAGGDGVSGSALRSVLMASTNGYPAVPNATAIAGANDDHPANGNGSVAARCHLRRRQRRPDRRGLGARGGQRGRLHGDPRYLHPRLVGPVNART